MHRAVLIAILVAAALVVAAPATASAAPAATSASLAKARNDARALEAEIVALDDQMKAAGGRYTLAKQQLGQVQTQIAANERRLAVTTRMLAVDRQNLARAVVAMYKAPPAELLGVLLATTDFTDLASGIDTIDRINSQGAAIVADVSQTKREILRRQAELASERARAAGLVRQVAQQQAQITAALQARQAMLAKAQAQVKTILRQIAAAASAGGLSWSLGPAAGDYTPQTWAPAFLRDARLPVTPSNVRAVVAWEMAEGGNWFNGARFNPLDTTMPEPGATDMNWVGVKAYTSWTQGFVATVATLYNGNYPGIIAALRAGKSAQAVADAVAVSPWGTLPFAV